MGEKLRNARIAKGLTQQEAADMIGVTRQALSSYESGRKSLKLERIEYIARVYGIELSDLLAENEDKLKASKKEIEAAIRLAILEEEEQIITKIMAILEDY